MSWRSAAIVAVVAMTAGAARAGDLEYFTGSTLSADCSVQPAASDYLQRHARCEGYILGVNDAQQAAQGAGRPARVCLPASASSTELIMSVNRYLNAHPEKRGIAAQDLVLEALSTDFPCK